MDKNEGPDPDKDSDGIPDVRDECPNEAENIDGKDDEDGCPDYPVVMINPPPPTRTLLLYDRRNPLVPRRWHAILNDIAQVMKEHSDIRRVQVAAHTGRIGTRKSCITHSRNRAHAVIRYLIARGVEPERLSAAGYGDLCPFDMRNTKRARARNRRVDFLILDSYQGCHGLTTICPEAVRAGLIPQDDRKYQLDSEYCKNR